MKNDNKDGESYIRCDKCGKRTRFVGETTDRRGRRYEKYRCFYCWHSQVYAVA